MARIVLTPEGAQDGQFVLRQAAKEHQCYVAHAHARQPRSGWWIPAEDCTPLIAKGDRYLEYRGEAAAYESGIRYCASCAVKHWPAYVTVATRKSPRPPSH